MFKASQGQAADYIIDLVVLYVIQGCLRSYILSILTIVGFTVLWFAVLWLPLLSELSVFYLIHGKRFVTLCDNIYKVIIIIFILIPIIIQA